jgi:hypothetical protein
MLKNKIVKLEKNVSGNKSYAERWLGHLFEIISIEARCRLPPSRQEEWTPDHLTESQRQRLAWLKSQPEPSLAEIQKDLPEFFALVFKDMVKPDDR